MNVLRLRFNADGSVSFITQQRQEATEMTEQQREIELCPYCNGTCHTYEYDRWVVECDDEDECQYTSGSRDTEEEALDAHNSVCKLMKSGEGKARNVKLEANSAWTMDFMLHLIAYGESLAFESSQARDVMRKIVADVATQVIRAAYQGIGQNRFEDNPLIQAAIETAKTQAEEGARA